ncbi:hypothetical protein KEM56_007467, partial [Ascosphaera pollenicola]
MSDRPRQTLGLFPAALRNPSSTALNQQSSTLSSRVEAKRAELENLQQLRDTSALLASRMQALEQKLSTLRDGTEAALMASPRVPERALTTPNTDETPKRPLSLQGDHGEEGTGKEPSTLFGGHEEEVDFKLTVKALIKPPFTPKKSDKPPTCPIFKLPGETFSKRKLAIKERKLKEEEEELRRRREFKAARIKANCKDKPTIPVRQNVASTARISAAKGIVQQTPALTPPNPRLLAASKGAPAPSPGMLIAEQPFFKNTHTTETTTKRAMQLSPRRSSPKPQPSLSRGDIIKSTLRAAANGSQGSNSENRRRSLSCENHGGCGGRDYRQKSCSEICTNVDIDKSSQKSRQEKVVQEPRMAGFDQY